MSIAKKYEALVVQMHYENQTFQLQLICELDA